MKEFGTNIVDLLKNSVMTAARRKQENLRCSTSPEI